MHISSLLLVAVSSVCSSTFDCPFLSIFFVSQKPKSTTAAEATRDINPDLQVEAHVNKVCPATESIYSDSFYSRLNVVVTALDNVEARRYVDRLVRT